MHALSRILVADRVLRAFIERHQDVAAEGKLHIDGGFRRERVEIAIEMRPEHHAVAGDFAHPAQAEDLVAARIREEGVGPRHEAVQPAHLADNLMPRAQIKMIGVGQQDLHAEIVGQVALAEAFDGGLRAHRHEDRGLDGSVRRVQQAGARPRVGALGNHFEGDLGQVKL